VTIPRTNKRPAQAMGKKIAEHVMRHASETTKHDAAQVIGRNLVAQEGTYASVEAYMRAQIAGDAAKDGRSVVGWEPVRYAVVDELEARDAVIEGNDIPAILTTRPGLDIIPLGHFVQIRVTGYGVPILEVK
jgi:hypothetical protein